MITIHKEATDGKSQKGDYKEVLLEGIKTRLMIHIHVDHYAVQSHATISYHDGEKWQEVYSYLPENVGCKEAIYNTNSSPEAFERGVKKVRENLIKIALEIIPTPW